MGITSAAPETDLSALLAGLAPEQHPGVYVFARLAEGSAIDMAACVCAMHEPDGMSIVVAADRVPAGAQTADYRASWITLRVDSSLAAVGLTAAVAGALAEAGISCNVVAATCHDHLFVPVDETQAALAVLETLQRAAARERQPETCDHER